MYFESFDGAADEWYDDALPDGTDATLVTVTAGETASGIDAELALGGQISGTVTMEGGAPATGGNVVIWVPSGEGARGAEVDGSGNYTFDHVAAGTYNVQFQDFDGAANEWYDDATGMDAATPVTVVAGGTTTGIDAELAPAGFISGTVTMEGGAPATGGHIYVEDAEGNYLFGWSEFDVSGNYTIGAIPAGTYILHFRDFDWATNEYYNNTSRYELATPVVVTAGETTANVDIELAAGGRVSGTVTMEGGAPAQGGIVCVADEEGHCDAWSQVDETGQYIVYGVQPGVRQVLFYGFDGAADEWFDDAARPDTATPVVVVAGETTTGIDAELALGGRISGTVTMEGGGPVGDGRIWFFDDEGNYTGASAWIEGGDGFYTSPGLAEGDYYVGFGIIEGAAGEWYDDDVKTLVHVTAGATTTGIDAELAPEGLVSGTVTVEGGDPATGGEVRIVDGLGETRSTASVDDLGHFVAGNLRAGDYSVEFSGFDGVADEWYDNASSFATATAVTVTSGATTSGIDAVLAPPIPTPAITDVSPVSGSTDGGTTVTLTGSALTGATAVFFDGEAGTSVAVSSDTALTVVTPAHAAGPVSVIVVTPGGASFAAEFTYVTPAPAISDVSPVSGSTNGGTSVTVTGTHFTGATSVTFDGSTGMSLVVNSDSSITVTTPARAAGLVDVIVTTPYGSSSPAAFTYVAPAPAGSISGSLTLPSGYEVGAHIDVLAFDAATGDFVEGDFGANGSGSYAITNLVPGSYYVCIQADDGAFGFEPDYYANYLVEECWDGAFRAKSGTYGPNDLFLGASEVTLGSDVGVAGIDFSLVEGGHVGGLVAMPADYEVDPDALTYAHISPADRSWTYTEALEDMPGFPGTLDFGGGGYTTQNFPAGEYYVWFDGTRILSMNWDGSWHSETDFGPTLVVPAGGSNTTDIDTVLHASATISGTVTNTAGSNVGDVCLVDMEDQWVCSVTDDAGAYSFTGLAAREYYVYFHDFAGAANEWWDDAPSFEDAFFTILEEGWDVTGIDATLEAAAVVTGSLDVPSAFSSGSACVGVFTTTDAMELLGEACGSAGDPFAIGALPAGSFYVRMIDTDDPYASDGDWSTFVGSDAWFDNATDSESATPIHLAVGQTLPLTFTWGPAPAVSDVSPVSGSTDGGTSVTVTGTHFTGATSVTFDGSAGTSLVVNSDSSITVTAPAHAAGPVDVVVTTPYGSSSLGAFTFVTPAPAITNVSPVSGSTDGGTSVTVTGTHFTGATSVTFDGSAGSSLVVNSDSSVTVTTPAHAAGPVDVVVTTPAGSSNAGSFMFVTPAPAISDVSPVSGSTDGGTTVTVTGTHFTGATSVTFGGSAGTSLSVDSDTQITVTTPAHAAGPVSVIVVTPGGASFAAEYTYVAPPAISNVSPVSGSIDGGTTVTLAGSGFTGATSVTFDGSAGSGLSVTNDGSLTVTTPAHAAGAVNVIVTTPYGSSTSATFTYVAPPVITNVSPVSGPTAGGTTVTLTGTGFAGATSVTFEGSAGGSLSVVNDGELTVVSPAHAAGAVNVVVNGPFNSSEDATFTYVAPAVTGVADAASIPAGGTAGATVTVSPVPGSGTASLEYLKGSVWTPFGTPVTLSGGSAHFSWVPPQTFQYRAVYGMTYSAPFTITVVPPTVVGTADSASIPGGGAAGATVTVSPVPGSGTASLEYLKGSVWTPFGTPVTLSGGSAHFSWVPPQTFQYRAVFGTTYSEVFTITVVPPTVVGTADSASIPGGGAAGATVTVDPVPGSGTARLEYLEGFHVDAVRHAGDPQRWFGALQLGAAADVPVSGRVRHHLLGGVHDHGDASHGGGYGR